MSTEPGRKREGEDTGNDKNIDVSRSENREAVANEAAHPSRNADPEGSNAGEQNRHRQTESDGSHQEGQYDKNAPQGFETVD